MRKNELQFIPEQVKKRIITLFLALTTTATLTACSINFTNPSGSLEHLDDTALGTMYEGISNTLEETNYSSEEGLQEIVDGVRSVAGAAERVEDVTFESATLVRVVDGDTIVVSINKEEYKVRLIGINTPESVAPKSYRTKNTTQGMLASDYTKHLLSEVSTVYLQTDISDIDPYGRLLRYVWLEIPEDPYDIQEVATKMLNGILVLDDVAKAVEYEPDTLYADMFEELAQ